MILLRVCLCARISDHRCGYTSKRNQQPRRSLLIGMSISRKSAALAGPIEISYPFFIALFATLLFKQPRPSSMTFYGDLLILAGVFLISYFNK